MSTLSEQLKANKAAIIKQADETAAKEKKQDTQNKQEQQVIQKQIEKEKQQRPPTQKEIIAAERKTLNEKYDSKISNLGSPPPKYIHVPQYRTNPRNGIKTLIGYNREPNNKAIQRHSQNVSRINRERNVAHQKLSLRHVNISPNAKAKALRHLNKHPNDSRNLVTLATNYQHNKQVKDDYTRRSSTTTAKSNAILSRVDHEKTIREFELNKIKIDPIKAGSAAVAIGTNQITKATKTRPGIKPSSYFSKKYKTPVSIIGNSLELSNKAVQTFEETQFQQQKLFKEITGAKDYKQAINLRETAQIKNPYVGTPNILLYKGGIVDSNGVLIEKVLNPIPITINEETTNPKNKLDKLISERPSQNIPIPETITSRYIPGGFAYIYPDIEKNRRQEEIALAGGTYGDYLKSIEHTPEYQLKMVGKGAARAVNSYTSLVGINISNRKVAGDSLIDTTFTDIYNIAYPVVVKPVKSHLEKLGISVQEGAKNSKPFELTDKAFHSRTPAENAGDIITFSTIEAGIFVATGGIGNLALRAGAGASSKLPYLLKGAPTISKVTKAAEKESKLISVTLDDGSKIRLTNFDYTAPTRTKKSSKKIQPAPGIPLKKIKMGKQNINVIDYDKLAKIDAAIKTTKTSKLNKLLETVKIPKDFDPVKTIETKVINFKPVRKIATVRIPKKDKGKKYPETGKQYNEANSDNFTRLPKPNQTAATMEKEAKQILKQLETPKKPRKGRKQNQQTQNSDVVIVDEIILHESRPRGGKLSNLLKMDTEQEIIIGTGIKSKSGVKLSERIDDITKVKINQESKLNQKTDSKSKKNQKQKLLYNLVVTPRKQGRKEGIKITTAHPPKVQTKQKTIVTQKNQTKFRIKPVTPIRIPELDNDYNPKEKKSKRKRAVKFSTWNVDVQVIGALPGEELEVSKTTKVFKRLDKRQDKAHSKTKKTPKKKGPKKTKSRKKTKKR